LTACQAGRRVCCILSPHRTHAARCGAGGSAAPVGADFELTAIVCHVIDFDDLAEPPSPAQQQQPPPQQSQQQQPPPGSPLQTAQSLPDQLQQALGSDGQGSIGTGDARQRARACQASWWCSRASCGDGQVPAARQLPTPRTPLPLLLPCRVRGAVWADAAARSAGQPAAGAEALPGRRRGHAPCGQPERSYRHAGPQHADVQVRQPRSAPAPPAARLACTARACCLGALPPPAATLARRHMRCSNDRGATFSLPDTLDDVFGGLGLGLADVTDGPGASSVVAGTPC